jgi:hypothetical protein
MVTPVNFNNYASRRCEKINHKPINWHLAFKGNPKPLASKTAPQHLLCVRTIVPHKPSAFRKQRLELEMLTGLTAHGNLRCPANQLGFAIHGATIHDTREPLLTQSRWRVAGILRRQAETS